MNTTTRFAAVLLGFSVTLGSLLASDWPAFRGAHGGLADDKDLPVQWTKDNILWKVKLPGAGTSSPITTGDKIILTCNAGYGTTITKGMGGKGGGKGKGGGGFGKGAPDTGEQKKLKLLVVCLDRANGKVVWQKEVEPKLPETPFSGMMTQHSYASSTPVTDGEGIFVFFGKSGVHAFGLDGKPRWSADVGSTTNKWGSASSPVLYKDLVIVNAAIESRSLVALDKKTGKEVWRQKGLGTTWTSPVLVETKDGKQDLVLNLPGKVVGYDPQTGKELWNCQGIGSSEGGFGGGYTASTPVAKDGIVYAIGGGGPTPASSLAVKVGGRGDVTKSHVLWRQKAGATNCSPILTGEHLCWVDGTVTCLKTSDGSISYKERLYTARGEYVSAVAAGDKIFALTRYEGLFVIAGGGKFEKLAHNPIEGDASIFNASPAISDGRMYLRSNEYLYCIGNK